VQKVRSPLGKPWISEVSGVGAPGGLAEIELGLAEIELRVGLSMGCKE